MRNGQNKRMRGRNNNNRNKGHHHHNPLTRVYESNGPDVKIRGNASHIAEKYIQLARDSQSSGDPVAAENYYQHAEHYFRLIAAAQEQFRQQNPYYNNPQQGGEQRAQTDENFDAGDDDGADQSQSAQNEPGYVSREPQPQPYLPRDAQPFPPRDQQFAPRDQQPHGGRPPQQQINPQHSGGQGGGLASHQDVGGLPSFITGGGQPQPSPPQQGESQQGAGPNGYDNQDRFPLHRRRRRHRGPRPEFGNAPGAPQSSAPGEGGDEPPRQPGE